MSLIKQIEELNNKIIELENRLPNTSIGSHVVGPMDDMPSEREMTYGEIVGKQEKLKDLTSRLGSKVTKL